MNIDSIPIFDSLKEPIRSEIGKALRFKSYAAQEQIIDRNSDSADVIFVCEGRVRVIIYSLSGREVALDEVGGGSFFGELAAIDSGPRSASVMAVEASKLAFLSSDNFIKVLKEDPVISLKVMRRMTKVIRQATSRIVDLSTLGANNRIHGELLRMAKEVYSGKGVPVIKPIPVHGELASRVSTTRETVARVMNDLSRRGIIKRNDDTLEICDMNRLEMMVEEVRGD